MNNKNNNNLAISFIPWTKETKNDFFKKYNATDENDFYQKATYERDVKITDLYQYMNKIIYCNKELNKCWYANTFVLNNTDGTNELTVFNNILKELGFNLKELELGFNLYKNNTIEIINYSKGKNDKILTLYPENEYINKFGLEQYKQSVINSIKNINDNLDNDYKEEMIKNINNIDGYQKSIIQYIENSDKDKKEKQELINIIKNQKDIDIIDSIYVEEMSYL